MHIVTLETYGVYDRKNDIQYMKEFNICVNWLTEYLKLEGIKLDDFLSQYTWDCSESIFGEAQELGIYIEVINDKL
ncbi:hypothetical protein J7E51_27765 [Priestia megaterium]|nr:hypothetical protein [Priestia megaterium]